MNERKGLGFDALTSIPPEIIERMKEIEEAKLRAESETDEGDTKEQFVGILVGDKETAFRVNDIEAILNVPKITPIPGMPPYVLGICNVRGEITSVLNLQVILGLDVSKKPKTRRQKSSERLLIVGNVNFSVGFVIDAVLDVIRVGETDVIRINAADSEMYRLSLFSRGIFTRPEEGGRGNDIIIIDTDKLLNAPEIIQFL
ncbi:MAG: chemotaxis protein CheW [Chloroherpetonaceae bacterium]|nr:chemotaxis protein CheW [Chloroherpetonaceae bacterium]